MKKCFFLVLLGVMAFMMPFITTWALNQRAFPRGAIGSRAVPSSPHTPILINGDAALAGFPDKTGDGSSTTPYIIKDITIDANGIGSCISINNTRAHLVIQNCTFTNSSPIYGRGSIQLRNASNIAVWNCSFFDDAWCGTYMYNTSLINVSTCTFDEPQYTVYSYTGSHVTIEGNTIAGFYGIHLSNTNHSVARFNDVSGATGDGILVSNSENVSVYHNQVHGCNPSGISIESCTTVNVSMNDVSNNNQDGIYLLFCSQCTVADNKGNFCKKNGLEVVTSTYNTISGNVILYSARDGLYLRSTSDHNTISNNRFLGSFTDDVEIDGSNNNVLSNNVYCSINPWTTTNTITGTTCEAIPDLNPSYSDYRDATHALVSRAKSFIFTYSTDLLNYSLYLCVMFLDNTTSEKVLISSAYLITETTKYVSNLVASLVFNLSLQAPGVDVQAFGVRSSQSPMISFSNVIHSFQLDFHAINASLLPMDLSVAFEYAVTSSAFSTSGTFQTTHSFPVDSPQVGIAPLELLMIMGIVVGAYAIAVKRRMYSR